LETVAGVFMLFCTTNLLGFPYVLRSGRTFQWGGNKMDLYAIRRRSAWANAEELESAAGVSARIGDEEMSDRVRWIRSYVVAEPDGRLGTICIYQARDVESIREHAQRVGMPGDEVEAIAKTVIIRDDPANV
jgi:hypothetical protein